MVDALTFPANESPPGREGYRRIFSRVEECAARTGRRGEVKTIAVSKHHALSKLLRAKEEGCRDFGENYVQELLDKARLLEGVNWHFIGRLQTNKVRLLLPWVSLIHTLDRPGLAREIDKRARAIARKVPVLIQVNLGRENQKGGVVPEETIPFARSLRVYEHLDLRGLMTIPPPSPNAEAARPWFQQLRRLRDETADALGRPLPELSMGMSADYETAIEEGATLVRIGTAIFGLRAGE